MEPQIADDLAEINARDLSDVLVLARGHEDQQVLEGLDRLEVFLKHGRRLLDDFRVGLEHLGEQTLELGDSDLVH